VKDMASKISVTFGIQHDWRNQISGVHVSPGSAKSLSRGGGITNHHLIACSLSNISVKIYQNRLMCIVVIVCCICVVFWDTVYSLLPCFVWFILTTLTFLPNINLDETYYLWWATLTVPYVITLAYCCLLWSWQHLVLCKWQWLPHLWRLHIIAQFCSRFLFLWVTVHHSVAFLPKTYISDVYCPSSSSCHSKPNTIFQKLHYFLCIVAHWQLQHLCTQTYW